MVGGRGFAKGVSHSAVCAQGSGSSKYLRHRESPKGNTPGRVERRTPEAGGESNGEAEDFESISRVTGRAVSSEGACSALAGEESGTRHCPRLIGMFAADLEANPDFSSLLQGNLPRWLLEEALEALLPDILTGSCDSQSSERLIALGIHELLHFRAIVTLRRRLMAVLQKEPEAAVLPESPDAAGRRTTPRTETNAHSDARAREVRDPRVKPQLQRVSLRRLVEEALRSQWLQLADQGIDLDLDLQIGGLELDVDAGQIRSVLRNLVQNAIEAMAGSPVRCLLVRSRVLDRAAEVRVRDTGPGIADPEIVFDFLYTTRSQGAGLGLSVAREIARSHGGDLGVTEHSAGGAELVLTLPITH